MEDHQSGQNYPQGSGGETGAPGHLYPDESPLWDLSTQVPVHHGPYNQQRNAAYQAHLLSYGNYGEAQQSSYPNTSLYANTGSYPSPHGTQLENGQRVNTYGSPPYVVASSARIQSYPPASNGYQQYSNYATDEMTISPQALHRNQPQIGGWRSGVTASTNGFDQAASYGQQSLNRENVADYSSLASLSVDDSTMSGLDQVAAVRSQGSENSRAQAARKGKLPPRESSLRITRPDLLSAALPAQRVASAPFLILHEEPIELKISGKAYKPLKTVGVKSSRPSMASSGSPSILLSTSVKRGRGRPSKGKESATKQKNPTLPLNYPQKSPSGTEDDSSSEEETDSDEDEEEMAAEELSDLRGDVRPTEADAAAAWDATGIVWVPRHREADRKEIIDAATKFEQLFATLRADLKKVNTEIAAAESSSELEKVKTLSDIRAVRRNAIISAAQAAVKHGHLTVLANFGRSQLLVAHIVNQLVECTKLKDFTGELPRALWELMSRFKYLDEPLLQKLRFEAIEKRFIKNGDDDIKRHISIIRAGTTESEERAKLMETEAKKPAKETMRAEKCTNSSAALEALKSQKAEHMRKGTPNASMKRTHESDGNGSNSNKKVAPDATVNSTTQKGPATKLRPNTQFFANLKRPGTKSAAAAAAAEKKSEAPQLPKSAIGDILDSIQRPKEVPKPPEPPRGPPETAEQMAIRQRKESRRHLRVRWAEGDLLSSIRLFEPVNDESHREGRMDNMLRGVDRDRLEGKTWREGLQVTMIDDEDDERPYPDLMAIDLRGTGLETNLVTRGGQVPFNTPQQQVQKQRESRVVMHVYTAHKDIPNSAKEPPQTSENKTTETEFTFRSVPWLTQRVNEIRTYGLDRAMPIWVNRIHEQKTAKVRDDWAGGARNSVVAQQYGAPPVNSLTQQPTFPSALASVLEGLKSVQHAQPVLNSLGHQQRSVYQPLANPTYSERYGQSAYQPTSQAGSMSTNQNNPNAVDPWAFVEGIAASLRGKPAIPREPPDWMTDPARRAEWWEGYYRDNPPQPQASQTQAPQVQVPQMQALQTPYSQASNYPIQTPSNMPASATKPMDFATLQSILQALNPAQNNTGPPQSNSTNMPATFNGQTNAPQLPQQQLWMDGWPSMNVSNNNTGYPTQNSQISRDNTWAGANTTESARVAYNENSRPTYDTSNQENTRGRGRSSGFGGDDRYRDPSDYKRGTKPCKYWKEGKCAKGSKCTYRHD